MVERIAPPLEDLEAIIAAQYQNPDFALIRHAYEFAEHAHGSTMRSSGHLFITHPVAVACILAEMGLGMNVIAGALLHDVIEDTTETFESVAREFGIDIANLVQSVTKLQQARYRGGDRYRENLQRMFLAMADDVRAILIKFADRLHNLQTLFALAEPERRRIAREALEIHAPIAGRLGMGEMKGELEDTAFKYDNSEAYEFVRSLIAQKIAEKEAPVEKIMDHTKRLLSDNHIETHSIHGRVKRLYSLYRKLTRYENDISRIYDVLAIRIIVSNGIEQCYAVLGLLHQLYKPLPGRIKDYIAQPKPNGYQSLHTTVFAEGGEIVEFQIRTEEMYEHAEFGFAAHWRFKNEGRITASDIHWIEELTTIRKELINKKDFFERLEEWKLDLFKDRIFVFTPKGDVIDLPDGASPVDFAYAIHTELGDTCISARTNGIPSKLDSMLKSGDICEIVVDKNRKGPSLDWIKFVKTRHAKNKIRENAKRLLPTWLSSVLQKRKK
ncbi:MAG: RelA/SpoT family protein [bacterium]|nr:RelA/SpoT family protein [bacterium]